MNIETKATTASGESEMQSRHFTKEGNQNSSGEVKRLRIGVGVLSFVSLFLLIFLIVYATTQNGDDDDNGNSNSEYQDNGSSKYCMTKECLALSESILASLDASVDPCEDFFRYACGGFQEMNEYQLPNYGYASSFSDLGTHEDNAFLDGLFYPEVNDLKTNPAVHQARQFFSACMNSTNNVEQMVASQLLAELVTMVDFDGAATWDEQTITKFHSALAWLGARSWNYLFSLSALAEGVYYLRQNYPYWLSYSSVSWGSTLNDTIVPLYQSLFNLSLEESYEVANDVWRFSQEVYNTTGYNVLYTDPSALNSYARWTNSTDVFGSSEILNFSRIIMEQFNTQTVEYGIFLLPDIYYGYFLNLATIISSTTPKTIQYYLFADVLIYGLNYQAYLLSVADQSRFYSRSDYCVGYTKSAFPYVYGYILHETMYSQETYEQAIAMVNSVINDGVKVLLNSNTFMDDESREATNEKIQALQTFVGFPSPVYNYSKVATYYSPIVLTGVYMENLQQSLARRAISQELLYNGEAVDMIDDWPSMFADPTYFPYWLTGINAFYSPSENFFTIPVTITQMPFFSLHYPSAINFGGLGSVIGHEMSHGFDPFGSLFDGQGNYIETSIWTTETKNEYDQRVQCIVDQYDGLEIENGIFVDGNRTQTENVADNSGNDASWLAWQEWRKKVNDPKLPINMTDEQLFFLGWARTWCEVTTNGFYAGWKNVHAPAAARVWGVVQNSENFARAFNCKASTPMNPDDKCELWA